MHTIDNANRIVYDYGQSAAQFLDCLVTEGEAATACFMNADGLSNIAGDEIAGSILRLRASEALPVDYQVLPGTDQDLLALDNINAASAANPDIRGWYAYQQPGAIVPGSALDASFLLDAPAGKYGVIVRQGDTFVTKNGGKEMEFWGTNVYGSTIFAMSDNGYQAEVDKLADRIAAAGFNLVRLHNLDGTTSHVKDIFGNYDPGWDNGWYDKASGKQLDAGQMDKLGCFIAALKQRGIYYWVDTTCYRRIFKDDGIDSFGVERLGLKGPTYYNRAIIDIQKEFTRLLMTYPNRFDNGRTMANDPAMVMVGLTNEYSLPSYDVKSKMNDPNRDDDYYDELCQIFSQWLKDRYKTEAMLKLKWGTKSTADNDYSCGLQSHEHLPSGSTPGYVEVLQPSGDKSHNRIHYTVQRSVDVETFYGDIMKAYFSERIAQLRDLGVQCAITGNTAFGDMKPPIFYANTDTDFIDIHLYRAHPHGGWDLATKGVYIDAAETGSMLKEERVGLIGALAEGRVYGYPYVISEWNDCPPNAYQAEGPLLMSAYGGLQGWTPIQFGFPAEYDYFENIENGTDQTLLAPFQGISNPVNAAMLPSAAIAFLRQDVSEAQTGYYNRYTKDDIFIGYNNEKHVWPGYYLFPKTGDMVLIGKTGVAFDVDDKSAGLSNDTAVKTAAETAKQGDKCYTSVTGELTTDTNIGEFQMDTQKSQAICGFIGSRSIAVSNLRVNVDNPYAAITLTSLTDSAIADSNRLLLTAVGQCRNHSQLLSEDGTTIVKPGKAPIMVEPITGSIQIHLKDAQGYRVYALNSDGSRKKELKTELTGTGISFRLTPEMEATNFEIVKQ